MKLKRLPMVTFLLATGAAALGQPASALDYHGYFRALAASNKASGGATCFKLSGALSKYRLGNECQVFGEFWLGQEVAKTDDGAKFSGNIMFTFDSNNFTDNPSVGLSQIYAQADNVPELNGASAWLGRRYYKRDALMPNDFFYWSGQGFGGGIEDYRLGNDVKFSYALLRKDKLIPSTTGLGPATGDLEQNGSTSATRHDFQLRGIPVNPNGTLEMGVSLIIKDSGRNASMPDETLHSGYALTVQHRQAAARPGGFSNVFALQYGVGPGTGGGDSAIGAIGNLTDSREIRRMRVVEGAHVQLTKNLEGELVALYQKDRGYTAANTVLGIAENKTWTSVGGQFSYGLTRHFKITADLGVDTIRPDSGPTRRLTKFTIAPTLSSGPKLYDRPDLRVFYTYGRWNEAARAAANVASPGSALSSSGAFGTATSGSMVGLQAEAWF